MRHAGNKDRVCRKQCILEVLGLDAVREIVFKMRCSFKLGCTQKKKKKKVECNEFLPFKNQWPKQSPVHVISRHISRHPPLGQWGYSQPSWAGLSTSRSDPTIKQAHIQTTNLARAVRARPKPALYFNGAFQPFLPLVEAFYHLYCQIHTKVQAQLAWAELVHTMGPLPLNPSSAQLRSAQSWHL